MGDDEKPTYRIVDWDKHFENSRSREIRRTAFVSIPNKHDGEGYAILMADHERGYAHFAAWVLMVQVASKCPTRGTLTREDGSPLDAQALAAKTRAPKWIFEESISRLVDIGWLECCRRAADVLPTHCRSSADVLPTGQEGTEQEGRGNARERARGAGASAPEPPPPSPASPSPEAEPDPEGIDPADAVTAEWRAECAHAGAQVPIGRGDRERAAELAALEPNSEKRRAVMRTALAAGYRKAFRFFAEDFGAWAAKVPRVAASPPESGPTYEIPPAPDAAALQRAAALFGVSTSREGEAQPAERGPSPSKEAQIAALKGIQ